MLFVSPTEEQLGFWMKDTLIPLDIIIAKSDGTIVQIFHNAKPMDETRLLSSVPAKAALEVNGGTADALGIKEGDRLESKDLGGS